MSKWLFCDIEASNGHDICSFGYVITNEYLEVLDRKDILIKPSGAFSAVVEKMLAYPKEIFFTSPTFDKVSGEIFGLITGADVVVGHAFCNEVKFLSQACINYKLQLPQIWYFDTQTLYAIITKTKSKQSLEHIVTALNIDINTISLHKADDDAYLTMMVLKTLCDNQNTTPSQIISDNIAAHGKLENNINYEYTDNHISLLKGHIKRYVNSDTIDNEKTANKKVGFCSGYLNSEALKVWTLAEAAIDNGSNIEFGFDVDIYIWDGDVKDFGYKKQREKKLKCKYMSIEQFCSILLLNWNDIKPHDTDNFCPIGKLDLSSDKVIQEYGQDRPTNNAFRDILSKLKI